MRIILFLLLALISDLCYGQSYRLFTTDQHLSSSLINNIYEDSKGMIWIATEDGLNRYDGSKVTIYKHDIEDKHSLVHNYVCAIFEDSHGNLYIGSYGGLQIYNYAEDNFSPRATDKEGKPFYNNVSSIIERKNGEIWVLGDYLSVVTIAENKQPIIERIEADIPIESSAYMIEDDNGDIWASRGEGVYQIITENGRIQSKSHKLDASICLCKDTEGNIYAGSMHKGLHIFDKKQEKFVNIPYTTGENLPVKHIFLLDSDRILLSTDGKGAKIYNIRTKEFSNYTFESANFESSTLKVHAVMKDRDENLWFALYQKGVAMIPNISNSFGYIGYKSVNKNVIGTSCITSLYRGEKGTLWVGTDNDGIYGLTPDNQFKIHFAPSGSQNSVAAIIMTIHEDTEGNLWYGSFIDGMGRIDTRNGNRILHETLADQQGRKIQRVYDFEEDNDKRLWIATQGSGLYYHDLRKKQTYYASSANVGLNQWICCLHYSKSSNMLYIGTYGGLYALDLETQQSKDVLSRRIILNIYEDANGLIWTGGSDGLTVWNPQTQESITYTIEDGLPSNTVYAIQGDENGYLWISTNNGLSQFNPSEKNCNNFYVGDGLQGNEFTKNSSLKDADGTLWFGGINGITYFNPKDISVSSKPWNIRITDFYLHDGPVRKGSLSGGKPIIDCPVYEATEFHLSHNDNTFSIEFSPIEYDAPERLNYVCAINDGEWIQLPDGINRYPFYNLSAGTYHFKVKSVVNGVYSAEKTITIHIAPVWWASIWAKLIYTLIIIGVIALIVYQMPNRYRSKQQMLEHMHAEEIKEAKLQFFINISHEIRTPISFIINPLQKLMSTDHDKERSKLYHSIYRNSERILRLINQLMDLRKIDKGKMQLAFQETEMVYFVEEMCESLVEQANQKNISLQFKHEGIDAMNLWVDPNYFDKILLNILSNAFKFTPEHGEITIHLKEVQDNSANTPMNHYAEITITDTGSGIPEEELTHIFRRFYQAPNSNSVKGTGIGLHLTHSLVELHHGEIFCQNNVPAPGCQFTVRIPMGKQHLSAEEICTDTTSVRQTLQDPIFETNFIEEEHSTEDKNKNATHHILIVEDNDEIRRFISLELSSKYHIRECSNGKEAMEEIFRKAPDLVISDWMMPEMDGLTLCRKIKTNINLNHIPVILLTAKAQEEDNIEALEKGADAYITKPFNSKILEKTISNLIQSREKLKNTYSGHQQQHNEQLDKIEIESPDEKLMARIMRVINNNMSNPSLTAEMIASQVGTSRVHLNRKLKELTNQTTREFIKNCRLKQAATLLSEKKQSIAEVAELTGFANPNNFSTAFKEQFGVSPSAYKEHLETQLKNEE